ncbi:PQ loop repeat-domain-containing protein [Gongronella butleri]|nr:PQ loop repeat-domain-containing protein [Gongronella butleri]
MMSWNVLSDTLGWTYVIAWSCSLYPQILLNWRRQSVRGLSIDYLSFHVLGFMCYSIFTLTFYMNEEIRHEYMERHGSGNLVRFNDVMFAFHGLVMSLVLVAQTYLYKGCAKHLSTSAAFVTWLAIIGAILVAMSVHYGNSEWIHFIYYLSGVKLAADIIKYMPQVWLNYRRKSTLGWSVHLILLDMLGGVFSVVQLVLDAYIERDWTGVEGDIVKLGLGVTAIFYDLIFLGQHCILYRPIAPEETTLISHRSSPVYGAIA